MAQYSIYEGFMDDLRKKVTRIKNKCNKYGCEFKYEEIGEEYKEVVDTTTVNSFGKHPVHNLRFVIIDVEGTAIINDWELVASVEHTEKGNIFSKALIDVEIPEKYRNSEPYCEHCNTNHYRKNTFIVRNTKTNEFKQVGKSCLRDFTFGMDASFAAMLAEARTIFEECEEKDYTGLPFGSGERYYDVKEVLQYAAETIKKFGYEKSDIGRGTKQKVSDFIKYLHNDIPSWWYSKYNSYIDIVEDEIKKSGFNPESNEAKEMAESALKWLDEQKESESNDYIHNLKVITALGYTSERRFGLLVSLFPTYNRDIEIQEKIRKEKEADKTSEHIGTIGQRIQINITSYKCITSWNTDFGETYVWKLMDDNGNVFTWKTSTYLDDECVGKSLKGTVKEHKVFRDVKQTELTRCKVA